MRVLFLGDDHPLLTCGHRAQSLRRLGHEVTVLNPRPSFPSSRIIGGLSTRVGFWPFVPFVDIALKRKIGKAVFDLAWIDCGPELSRGFCHWLRKRGLRVINYNCDDPFGGRDGRKWDLYRDAVREHDLTVVVREPNIAEAKADGARCAMRVFMSYDPVAHAPVELSEADRKHWASEVVFVGSWMPERGPFFSSLLKAGVPLSIWGDHWQKAPEYDRLRPAHRGPAVFGADYVKAIQCSKIALGLLSKGNRDLHTQRSVEIPFIGTLLCCEKTLEHLAMFEDGGSAVMWSTADDCASVCQRLLADPELRKRVALAGRKRIEKLGLNNDEVLRLIIDRLVNTKSNRHD